jgi:glycosyltransferase involved in cell wall biosynthesis
MTSVLHVSFSHGGGAGEVARRLSHFQRELGWDSRFASLASTNLRANPFSLPAHTVAAVIDDGLIRSGKHGAPVSVVRDTVTGKLSRQIPEPDVLHLHWINGVGSLRFFREAFPKSALVMTLHDMNPFTGACHYSLGCTRYETGCGGCPAVKPIFSGIVAENFQRKRAALEDAGPVVYIAPSNWIRDCAKDSLVLREQRIAVIKNPLSEASLGTETVMPRRGKPVVFLIVANNLDDPVKGVDWALESLRSSGNHEWQLRLVGERKKPLQEDSRVVLIGPLSSERLQIQYAAADGIIIPSPADNAPLVFSEATAQGLFPLVRKEAGLPELIGVLKTGSIFETQEDLRRAVHDFVSLNRADIKSLRSTIRRRTLKEFDPVKRAKDNLALYKTLM